jgi:hypothetical protein
MASSSLPVRTAIPAAFASCLTRTTDEIQTGFYRTGKPFAIEHSGVVPDVIVYAKGFANGMPISGIVTRKEIMDSMAPGSLVSAGFLQDLPAAADMIRAVHILEMSSPAPRLWRPRATCGLMTSPPMSTRGPSRFSKVSRRSRRTLPTAAGSLRRSGARE